MLQVTMISVLSPRLFLRNSFTKKLGVPIIRSFCSPSNSPSQDSAADEELAKRVSELEQELHDAKAKVVYSLAEMENVRAISRRDAENARKFAIQGFAKGLLDVADNLSRAINAVPSLQENQDPVLSNLLEGVKMTESQLFKVFASQGLERFGDAGDEFDPNLHDALYEYEDDSISPGSVGKVLKQGYRLHGRVIRAAQVGCVKK